MKFTAKNRSSLETRYQWLTYPSEFSISPSEGILSAQASEKFEIQFRPGRTSLFKGVAECRFGAELEYSKKIALTALAAFPQIFIGSQDKMSKDATIDWGNVEKGRTAKETR